MVAWDERDKKEFKVCGQSYKPVTWSVASSKPVWTRLKMKEGDVLLDITLTVKW